MAVPREQRPYSQFNFTVEWDGLTVAGFQEVSGLGMEITVAEYRTGDHHENSPIKITGTYKVPDVTFKRGVVGVMDLYTWLNEVRDGGQEEQLKDVTVVLKSENREDDALTWMLINARPIKYTGPALNGKGTDVAVEELVLAAERIVSE